MSLLFFGDVHFGIKAYGTQDENGIFSSELDTMNALEAIYERCTKSDIELIACGGDWFHVPNNTSKNIKWTIGWLNKIEALNKKFVIIPGNHDCSTYSNSLVFIKELGYKNIFLIEKYNENFFIQFGKHKIYFVPYEMNLLSKEKDVIIHSNFMECIKKVEDSSIVISHLQEFSCQIGAEGKMISKGVDVVDINTNKNIILLLSHIHKSQIYKKSNTIICYPGSTTYMDAGDLNQDKGYIIVSETGEITFEPILNTRKFIKYTLTKDEDVIEFFTDRRLIMNSVIFIEYCNDFDITKLTEMFKNKQISIGWCHKIKENKSLDNIEIETTNVDNYSMYKQFIEKKYKLNLELKYKDDVINEGIKFINNHIGQNYE